MSQSWNKPNVNNPILQDVTAQKAMNDALAKMDVQDFIDLPPDSKRMAINESTGEASFEVLKNNSWVKIAKIDISAKQVGGFTPSQLVQNNAVVVRDAQGNIAGDITGNANSANSAQTLSKVLDIALGGTGGATIEAARENLSVPSKTEFSTFVEQTTNNISNLNESVADNTFNIAQAQPVISANATAIQDAKDRGQTGNVLPIYPVNVNGYIQNMDDCLLQGSYSCRITDEQGSLNYPPSLLGSVTWCVLHIEGQSDSSLSMRLHSLKYNTQYIRGRVDDVWGEWEEVSPKEVQYAVENGQIGSGTPNIPDGNLNTLTRAGNYSGMGGEIGSPPTMEVNSSDSRYLLEVRAWQDDVYIQTATHRDNYVTYRRSVNISGVISEWVKIWPNT